MKYYSTKEIGALWGISSRRAARLAAEGRIPGAFSTGNTWMIPADAPKPEDRRRKETKNLPEAPEQDIYPYLIAVISSDEQLNRLTGEEKEMYRACVLYEKGEFDASGRILEALRYSENRSIRIGALYTLAFISMYQADYASAEKYAVTFKNEYYSISEPSLVLRILFSAFEAEMGRTAVFVDSMDSLDFSALPSGILPFVAGQKLYAELVKFSLKGTAPDLSPYEMLCVFSETENYRYSAMYLHFILSLFYSALKDNEKEYRHFKRAIDLCAKYDYWFTASCLTHVVSETMEELLNRLPANVETRMKKLSDVSARARTEYAEYLCGHSMLPSLDENDYRLITCCLQGLSIEKTARTLGLSRSGTNRRLSVLYKKMGVENMKDLKKTFLDSIFDWRKFGE